MTKTALCQGRQWPMLTAEAPYAQWCHLSGLLRYFPPYQMWRVMTGEWPKSLASIHRQPLGARSLLTYEELHFLPLYRTLHTQKEPKKIAVFEVFTVIKTKIHSISFLALGVNFIEMQVCNAITSGRNCFCTLCLQVALRWPTRKQNISAKQKSDFWWSLSWSCSSISWGLKNWCYSLSCL